MSNIKFARFHERITQIVFTILLGFGLYFLGETLIMQPSDAMSTYHVYPEIFEYFLAGIILYLAFSLVTVKIHRS